MAETTKLSVGQALDKLRGTDAPLSKMSQLEGKIDALDQEMQLLRATRHRLERDQQASSVELGSQKEVAGRVPKLVVIIGITIGLFIVALILGWRVLQL